MMLPVATPSPPQPTGPVLRDIHLPPDPSWWPPAPGWWVLAALTLLLACLGWWMAWRHRCWRRRVEAVLSEIDAIEQRHAQRPDALAAGLHQWLRRGARIYDPMATHHRGDAWRRCLAVVPVDAATLDSLMTLESVMYRPTTTVDVHDLAGATRRWLALALKQRAMRKKLKSPVLRASLERGHV
ncbi:DUF4381 domain-containing protein [Dyella subtropica]|uniref:DUF4381 domain-containing protein n=1 Tax=Dyella subtropica TaxID=2992127 RepID=UPI00224DD1CA|nr:DUF4381 domain-containing protein [Dyella subtropica]